jgi:hypothetical protein
MSEALLKASLSHCAIASLIASLYLFSVFFLPAGRVNRAGFARLTHWPTFWAASQGPAGEKGGS